MMRTAMQGVQHATVSLVGVQQFREELGWTEKV